MAQQQDPKDFVWTFGITAGVKRDGSQFESVEFTDSTWCRFQRGVPKKMGGYLESFRTNNGIPRGLMAQPLNNSNYVFLGNETSGIDAFVGGSNNLTGTGPYPATFINTYGQTAITSVTNQTTFVCAGDVSKIFPVGQTITFTMDGAVTFNVATVTVSGTSPNVITTIVTMTAFTGTPTAVWAYNSTTPFGPDPFRQWQFDVQYFGGNVNALQLIAHGAPNLRAIDATFSRPVYTGNILPENGTQWIFSPLADTAGQNPTGQIISVDGGIVCGYPFLFAYGSSGLIQNNNVEQGFNGFKGLNDWNGRFANSINAAAGKIVKGFPIRGGTASPSVLFWATDSVIRASFNPQGGAGLFWQYDLVASRISILSSNSIVPADGAFYWIGVDRFYQYNGSVKVLPNNKNLNYFFDNVSFAFRQKVWGTFVPKFNEVWWFFVNTLLDPLATECNDAIIYQTDTGTWYDAGGAVGARRSCGYQSEVFPYPTWAGWELSTNYTQQNSVIAQPAGLPAPTNSSFYVAGNQTNAFGPGNFASLRVTTPDVTISVLTAQFFFTSTVNATLVTLTKPIATTPLAIGTVVWAASASGAPTWTHEYGVDQVQQGQPTSIYSSVTTNDISWVGGNVAQDQPQGLDRSMKLIRIEPNFKQIGDMTVQVLGRSYASSPRQLASEVRTFSPDTDRIYFNDVDYRQMRLKFSSDSIGSSWEMGRLLIKVDHGSEMPNL